MTVTKGQIYADRDSRRKGREVEIIHVEDGYATVKVITDSEGSAVSSVGKTTDVRLDRLAKAYTYSGLAYTGTGQEELEDWEKVLLGVANPNLSEEYKANIVTQYGHTDLATWGDDVEGGYVSYAEKESNTPEKDDEFIEDTNDLEDALRTAGYHWLPPVEGLFATVNKFLTGDPSETPEVIVSVIHQIISERLAD